MNPRNNILIVGIGNVLRGDDGIGAYIASRIEHLRLPGVQTMAVQQLHIELLDDFLAYNHIVLVDASVSTRKVSFSSLTKQNTSPAASTHKINAALLHALARQLYHTELSIMLCAIEAVNFEAGEQFSFCAKKNADSAISTICKWIKNKAL